MTTGGRWAGGAPEDRLLSQLYQHVAEQKAAQFGAGYDVAAGLDRYWAWLREHVTEEQAALEASRIARAMAVHPSSGGTGTIITTWGPGEAVTVNPVTQESPGVRRRIGGIWAAPPDTPRAVIDLYRTHYHSLAGVAKLLVGDVAAAEVLVQDAYTAVHAAWPRLADRDRALAYLRQSVVNGSRLILRHRADAAQAMPTPDPSSHEPEAVSQLERSAVISALRALPIRQREAVVLRYYVGLSEDQISAAMGVSRGAVKSHTARGLSALRSALPKAELRGVLPKVKE